MANLELISVRILRLMLSDINGSYRVAASQGYLTVYTPEDPPSVVASISLAKEQLELFYDLPEFYEYHF